MKHTLIILALAALTTTSALAHHGRDFILVEDYSCPAPGGVFLLGNFEWEKGNEGSEYGFSPSLMVGVLPQVSLSVETSFREEVGADWKYTSVTPTAHIQLTPTDSKSPVRFGLSAGYQFADSPADEPAAHHEEEAGHHGGEAEAGHHHSGSSIHNHDDSALVATRDLIESCPTDAWAHRQLALLLADRGRPEEAQAAVYRSAEIEPESPSRYAVAAHVFRTMDRIQDAIAMLKEAVRANPDFEPAIAELVNVSRGRKEKGQALKYIAEQLRKKPHTGDGLVAYRDAYLNLAEDDDDHEKLLDRLTKFNDARPDLWQSWSLVVQQYGIMHRLEEAHTLARETAERFPLAAKVWLDLGADHFGAANGVRAGRSVR